MKEIGLTERLKYKVIELDSGERFEIHPVYWDKFQEELKNKDERIAELEKDALSVVAYSGYAKSKDDRISLLEEMIRSCPIGFYAHKGNWQTPEDQGYVAEDSLSSGLADMIDSDDDTETSGKRAREYESKYKDELQKIRGEE